MSEDIQLIRKALKALAPTLSVRRGRGTAYSFVQIRGSGPWGEFTPTERKALEQLGLVGGSNFCVIPPESRQYYAKRAAEVLSRIGER